MFINQLVRNKSAVYKQAFQTAKPFKHIIIEGFFKMDFFEKLLSNFLVFEQRKAVNEGEIDGRATSENLSSNNSAYARAAEYFCSKEFLNAITEITGIENLICDSTFYRDGAYGSLVEQELNSHADFNYDPKTEYRRCLNLILYLNKEWEESWRSSIESVLNSHGFKTDQIKSFVPDFNKCVIVEMNERSWHGFPKTKLPTNKQHFSGKSISLYFYTKDRPSPQTTPSYETRCIPQPLLGHIKSNSYLSEEDYQEIQSLLRSRDTLLEFYQDKELKDSRQIQALRSYINHLESLVRFPATGYVIQEGGSVGLWADGWCSHEVKAKFKVKQEICAVQVVGYMPDFHSQPNKVIVTINGASVQQELINSDAFIIKISIKIPENELAYVSIVSTEKTSGIQANLNSDSRELAFLLTELRFIHAEEPVDKLRSFPPYTDNETSIQIENSTSLHVPAGHFYSPIISIDNIRQAEARIWPSNPEILEIDFNDTSHKYILSNIFPRYIDAYDYPAYCEEGNESGFYTENSQFSWLDAKALFVMLRYLCPKNMIEIGSGYSSLLTADVNRRFLNSELNFTCVEPYPRNFLLQGVPGISSLIQQKVEDLPVSIFTSLKSGDILFIDSSHVVKTGGDVNYIFFEIIPRLATGVFIHIHDIFLPADYPKDWVINERRSWNEQYLVQAALMYTKTFDISFSCAYALHRYPSLLKQVLKGDLYGGGSIWLQKKGK
jgi:Rps23 Pro-64 3,4-dihydroxylase Tpa1-like proline 4-hydroxylase